MEPMRRAIFHITPDLLAKLLHLPQGVKMVQTSTEMDSAGRVTVSFLFEHDSIPEGEHPHMALPTWRSDCRAASPYWVPVFQDWGINTPT